MQPVSWQQLPFFDENALSSPKPGTGSIEKAGWAEPESRCLPVSDKSGSARPAAIG